MAHKTAIRNGMTSSDEAALSNIPVAFINAAGGQVGANDYKVVAQGSPNNTVSVGAGRSYIPNSVGTMQYSTYLDTAQNVTIGANASGNARIDSVVLYCNLSATPDATASNVALLANVQGTPSGSPVAPSGAQIIAAIGAGNPYLILANIAVANGFTSIVNGNITDQRIFASFLTGQTMPIPQYIEYTDQGAAPSSPASGKMRMYTKGQAFFGKNTAGGIFQIGEGTVVANGNSGASPSVDWSQGKTQSFTLNSATPAFTFSNPVAGIKLVLILLQDATGSRQPTWPAAVKWPNGTAPTMSGANKFDLVGFVYDGTNYYGITSLTY